MNKKGLIAMGLALMVFSLMLLAAFYLQVSKKTLPYNEDTGELQSSQLRAVADGYKALAFVDQGAAFALQDTIVEFFSKSGGDNGCGEGVWERLVEEKLLNKVVTRFERGVHTMRLSRLTDITDEDITLVNRAMGKCSTYFTGHDSAAPMGDPYPTIDEVEDDLKEISNFLDSLINMRKRSN